jgi:hypothetical protein
MNRSTLIALLAVAAGLMGVTMEPPATRYQVNGDSRFWIDGSATTGAFSCVAEEVSGLARLNSDHVDATVTVSVAAFDCGMSRMNRDFFAALRGDSHPTIRFELDHAAVLENPLEPGAPVPVLAVGTLYLAGASQRVAIRGIGRHLPDGQVQISGRHPLRMSDFGIKPPSGLLGLIRTNDRVVARFELAATPQ